MPRAVTGDSSRRRAGHGALVALGLDGLQDGGVQRHRPARHRARRDRARDHRAPLLPQPRHLLDGGMRQGEVTVDVRDPGVPTLMTIRRAAASPRASAASDSSAAESNVDDVVDHMIFFRLIGDQDEERSRQGRRGTRGRARSFFGLAGWLWLRFIGGLGPGLVGFLGGVANDSRLNLHSYQIIRITVKQVSSFPSSTVHTTMSGA